MVKDVLPTEKTKIKRDPAKARWLLYGPPKIGKSTICSHMPKPLFFSIEAGNDFQEIFGIPMENWEQITYATESLKEHNDGRFDTAIIDTVGVAWDYCLAHVCKKHRISHPSDLKIGKGYDLIKTEFRLWMHQLTSIGLGVVLIAHEKLEMATFKGEEDDMIKPFISGSLYNAIMPEVDIIARMYFDSYRGEGKMQTGRFIVASPHPKMETGDRTGVLSAHDRILVEPESECWQNVANLFEKE
jgi:hypothetical protein